VKNAWNTGKLEKWQKWGSLEIAKISGFWGYPPKTIKRMYYDD